MEQKDTLQNTGGNTELNSTTHGTELNQIVETSSPTRTVGESIEAKLPAGDAASVPMSGVPIQSLATPATGRAAKPNLVVWTGIVAGLFIMAIGGALFARSFNKLPPTSDTANSTKNADSVNQVSPSDVAMEKLPEVPYLRAAAVPYSGLPYTHPDTVFKVTVPNGWALMVQTRANGGASALVARAGSDIVYKATQAPLINPITASAEDCCVAFMMAYDPDASTVANKLGKLTKQSSTKLNGYSVSTYYRYQTAQPKGTDIPIGAKEYYYVISNQNHSIHITHDVKQGDTDMSGYIEQLLQSISIR